MAELVVQRADDDCTICAIAMATGLPYERVMAVAAVAQGGYRYQGTPGTMSPRGVLLDLGFAAERVICGAHIAIVRKFLWGRRAILSMPSLNGFDGHHDVYWDGRAIRDPSPKTTYPEDALTNVKPLYAVILDERAAPDATDLFEAMEDALREGTPTLSLQAGHLWIDDASFDARAIIAALGG